MDFYNVLWTFLFLIICAVCAVLGWIGGSISPIRAVADFFDRIEEDGGKCCETCHWDLGGGCCRINLEGECREGGGFEAWEAKRAG